MNRIASLALVICVAIFAPARAQDNDASPTGTGFFNRDALTGDWLGARKTLMDQGITLGADEIVDALGNPTGGQKQGMAFEGRFEVFANIDLATALDWKGVLFHLNAYQIHGRGLSADDIGNLLTVSNIGATPATRLFGLWLQQSLFEDSVSIRAGQIAADDEFFVSQYAALFLNSTFGWPSVMGINLPSGGPAYPLATPGVRLRVAITPALIATTAVFNGDPAPAGRGDPQLRDASGTAFRLDGGIFWISELSYGANLTWNGDELPGTYKLGGWYHDGLFADQRLDTAGNSLGSPLSSGRAALNRGDFGGYVIADQLLWRTGSSSDWGLGAFLRAGGDPADRNMIEFHFDTGLTYAGPLPGRDGDTLGIGMSFERVSGAQRQLSRDLSIFTGLNLPLADFESAMEVTYQAQIAPWWMVQPDAQLILHPGARISNPAAPSTTVPTNALILGLRTAISL